MGTWKIWLLINVPIASSLTIRSTLELDTRRLSWLPKYSTTFRWPTRRAFEWWLWVGLMDPPLSQSLHHSCPQRTIRMSSGRPRRSTSSDCPNQSTWFERNRHGEEKLQDHIRVRRKADERQADLQRMQEASRSFKISPVRPCKGWRSCQRWCPDWCQNSLRKKSFQPQRLDRSYLPGHDDRWKWNHQNLRQKMGHRGLLQDLQEFLEAWHWIPWPVIWCIDCPYSFRLSAWVFKAS